MLILLRHQHGLELYGSRIRRQGRSQGWPERRAEAGRWLLLRHTDRMKLPDLYLYAFNHRDGVCRPAVCG